METTENMHHETKYAGFWIRFAASLLDGIVLFACNFLVALILNDSILTPSKGFSIFEWIFQFAYYVVLTAVFGQTLGKMAVGIRVIKQDGSKVSWGTALLREVVGKFISAIILFIGYIMAGFDSKKRALHDRISDTYVVRTK